MLYNSDTIKEREQSFVSESPVEDDSLDPRDWPSFRTLAHEMLDRILDLNQGIRESPVWRQVPPEVEARLQSSAPRRGIGIEQTCRDFLVQVMPYWTGNIHPRFWGWVGGSGTPTGMIAEMLSGGMNSVCGNFNDGAARVERQVIDWMKEVFGYPPEASGVLTSGGSVANMIGLAAGRDAMAGYDVAGTGVGSQPGKLVFYASDEVHSSVLKGARFLGLGSDAARLIPVDSDYRIRPGELEKAIAVDRTAGRRPFAVIGTAGTVNTGALDDLEALAEIARRERLWLHVDGAFGAFLKLSPAFEGLVAGMEKADSIAFDFHKWMQVQYEAGCVLVRRRQDLLRTFNVEADYLQGLPRGLAAQPDSTNHRGPQLSRGFKALKVWMSVKEHGFEAFGRLVARNVEQAQYLARRIERTPQLEILAPVPLNVVCFRYAPSGLSEEQFNQLNKEILMQLQEGGIAAPSSTVLQGRFAIRVANVNHRSRRGDFDLLLAEVLRIGARAVARGLHLRSSA